MLIGLTMISGKFAIMRQRDEALGRMIGELRIDRRRDRHHAARADEQRVAVGRLVGDELGRDAPARRRPVLDHELLAEESPPACCRHSRAKMSLPPPAANGTITRIGLLG